MVPASQEFPYCLEWQFELLPQNVHSDLARPCYLLNPAIGLEFGYR